MRAGKRRAAVCGCPVARGRIRGVDGGRPGRAAMRGAGDRCRGSFGRWRDDRRIATGCGFRRRARARRRDPRRRGALAAVAAHRRDHGTRTRRVPALARAERRACAHRARADLDVGRARGDRRPGAGRLDAYALSARSMRHAGPRWNRFRLRGSASCAKFCGLGAPASTLYTRERGGREAGPEADAGLRIAAAWGVGCGAVSGRPRAVVRATPRGV
ncbi:hypothetical protein BVI1335_3130003 [Burkholderia vietnamiensis]|nr:hypothetical protein BVI1335_3130003 [Burkholderia vietnamiensis]